MREREREKQISIRQKWLAMYQKKTWKKMSSSVVQKMDFKEVWRELSA